MTSLLRKIETRPDVFHGVEALDLHVGDPIPTPRAPERYAVRVTPDLARYLLTFNHENNRRLRERAAQKYAADMVDGYWAFTPQSVIFSTSGTLEDGQNRLLAVTIAGTPQWIMFDFGWPAGIITQIDRGAARTNSDAFKTEAISYGPELSGAMTIWFKYHQTAGTSLSWSARPAPSATKTLEVYRAHQDVWDEARRLGMEVKAQHKALGASLWIGAFYIIAEHRGEKDTVTAFYRELIDGSGGPGSVTRKLEKQVTRVKVSQTRTGDPREWLEDIIRAFNAWVLDKTYSWVAQPGFTLDRPTSREKQA